jgi:hypothetical protein
MEGNWSHPGMAVQKYISKERYHTLHQENTQLLKQVAIWQAKYETIECVPDFLDYFTV